MPPIQHPSAPPLCAATSRLAIHKTQPQSLPPPLDDKALTFHLPRRKHCTAALHGHFIRTDFYHVCFTGEKLGLIPQRTALPLNSSLLSCVQARHTMIIAPATGNNHSRLALDTTEVLLVFRGSVSQVVACTPTRAMMDVFPRLSKILTIFSFTPPSLLCSSAQGDH